MEGRRFNHRFVLLVFSLIRLRVYKPRKLGKPQILCFGALSIAIIQGFEAVHRADSNDTLLVG